MESRLCARAATGEVLKDSAGNAVLECLCGNVIRGCVEVVEAVLHGAREFLEQQHHGSDCQRGRRRSAGQRAQPMQSRGI